MKSSIFLFFAIALMTTACQKETLEFPQPDPKNVISSEVSDRAPNLWISNKQGYFVDIEWSAVPSATNYVLTVRSVGLWPSQKQDYQFGANVQKTRIAKLNQGQQYRVYLTAISHEGYKLMTAEDTFNSGVGSRLPTFTPEIQHKPVFTQ